MILMSTGPSGCGKSSVAAAVAARCDGALVVQQDHYFAGEFTPYAEAVDDASERHCLLRAHSPISIWFEAACKEDARTQADQPSNGRGDGEAASAGSKSKLNLISSRHAPTRYVMEIPPSLSMLLSQNCVLH